HDLVGDELRRRPVGAFTVEVTAEVVHEHLGALAREEERVLAAQAAARAGDDRDSTLECPHGLPLLWLLLAACCDRLRPTGFAVPAPGADRVLRVAHRPPGAEGANVTHGPRTIDPCGHRAGAEGARRRRGLASGSREPRRVLRSASKSARGEDQPMEFAGAT